MSGKRLLLLIVLGVLFVVASGAIYVVDEREKAIVFQFGEIVRWDDEPGLHFKKPFVNNVKKYDARMQTLDADPEEYLTLEKKNLIVYSFVKWRVEDGFMYYTKLGGLAGNARSRLSQRVNDALRSEFGKRTVQQVIAGDRKEIMDVVREAIDQDSREFGIVVVDLRLKRVDLDPEISGSIYQRMVAERSRVAKELRAQGAQTAEIIRADADRQREIILANADREAQVTRGRGDAKATKVFADAFGQDRDFYRLYRSLDAYQSTFSTPDNLLVIEPSSEFFRYFNDSEPAN